MTIPKIIISIWIGGPIPSSIKEHIASHSNQVGFEHRWVTNDNYYRGSRYVNECIEAGLYGKATDYLRMHYLEEYGGIYLDADTLIMKPLDRFLEHELFVCEEENQFIANGIVGAIPHHPLIQHYLGIVERNFRGGGELVFQPGMYLWTELIKYSKWSDRVTIYPAEWFLPFNHQSKETKITENTHTNHLYLKSWITN
jgi:mannosyltransferase OCH1-like enzyme